MLFNSQEFVFLFLPLVWLVFDRLRRAQRWQAAIAWLAVASLGFYAWWDWRYLALICASIAANYFFALALAQRRASRSGLALLLLGVLANLGALTWFKYAGFIAQNWFAVTGIETVIPQVVLPLGISFFTFQQIAYLVDVWREQAAERDPVRYALFVAFFPQLIAGPIVHHRQMMPAFAALGQRRDPARDLAVGLSIFALGLAKKVLIADTLAPHVGPVFDAPAGAPAPDFVVAWTALLAYSLQLYFDFSGYSDMAIGLARMFGIPLPVNFFSPYKAHSIAEFWRRWHMTLSGFLRDYLYFPLGGSRFGVLRTGLSLFLTMAIGGLWHGANWTFVLWGCWHGVLLVGHRIWTVQIPENARRRLLPRPLAIAITLLLVTLGWTLFRAPSLDAAFDLYAVLLWPAAVAWPQAPPAALWPVIAALMLALFAPNTSELFAHDEPGLLPSAHQPLRARRLVWSMRPAVAMVIAGVLMLCLLSLSRETVFLYFQF